MDTGRLVRDKVDEYLTLLSPLERAEQDVQLARKMLRARTEEELHAIAPVLGALADALQVSAIDLVLASDRPAFLQAALDNSELSIDEIRGRLIDASATAGEDLRVLGIAGLLQGQ